MDNPTQRKEITELYKRYGGNIRKVAHELGLKSFDVNRMLTPITVVRHNYADSQPKPNKDEHGNWALGRPELRPFIVSYRHALGLWPEEHRGKLARARQAYDAGTHIMVQGRDGCWIIQYLWSRQRPVAPVNWFYGAFA